MSYVYLPYSLHSTFHKFGAPWSPHGWFPCEFHPSIHPCKGVDKSLALEVHQCSSFLPSLPLPGLALLSNVWKNRMGRRKMVEEFLQIFKIRGPKPCFRGRFRVYRGGVKSAIQAWKSSCVKCEMQFGDLGWWSEEEWTWTRCWMNHLCWHPRRSYNEELNNWSTW